MSNHAILLCFVRYSEDEDLREELLCCFDLPGRATSSKIFNTLDDGYFQAQGLDCSKCVGMCADGCVLA